MSCLDETQVLAFVDGRVSDEARRAAEAHLDACESCLELVAQLGRFPVGSGPARAGDDPPAGAATGAATSRYELGAEIARGGMGRIVRAHDRLLNRAVALKLLRSPSAALERRFAREAELAARLEHPAIVPIYDAGTLPDGSAYHAMRLVAGETLERAVARAASPADRLALVPAVTAVADAVAYAHRARVIHRDLKPANVLVGRFGETLLLDWGLAKDLGDGEGDPVGETGAPPPADGLTARGLVMGTHGYMAPEQARGQAVDERADVYALGATLYHVLAGAAPGGGGDDKAPPEPIERRVPDVPADLAAIVTRAMSPRPDDRYPSAAELAEDLHRFQTGRLVEAHRYGLAQLLRRWVARHRAAVAVSAAALAIIATISIVAVTRIVAARDLAERQRVAAESERARATLQREAAERMMAFVLGGLRNALERVGRLDALSGVAREIIDYYDSIPPAGEPHALDARERRVDALGILVEARVAAGEIAGALEAARQGVSLAREAAAARAGEANDERLCRALLRFGDALRAGGKGEEAVAAVRECEAVARPRLAHVPGAALWQELVAHAALELGTAALAAGDAAGAHRLREEARDLGQRLDAAGNPAALQILVRAYTDLTRAAIADRELARAAPLADAALSAAQRWSNRLPDDIEAQHTLAAAWDQVGQVARERTDLAAAAAAFEFERAILVTLRAREPNNMLWRRSMTVVEDNLGQVALDRGDRAAALKHFVTSRDETAELSAAQPDNPKLIRDLAVSDFHLGDLHLELASYADARAAYAAAVKSLERLDPSSPDNQRDLATALLHLAELEVKHGSSAAARTALERSVTLARSALAGGDTPGARALVASALLVLADVDRGRAAASIQEAIEVMAPTRSLAGEDPELAAFLADLDRAARKRR